MNTEILSMSLKMLLTVVPQKLALNVLLCNFFVNYLDGGRLKYIGDTKLGDGSEKSNNTNGTWIKIMSRS